VPGLWQSFLRRTDGRDFLLPQLQMPWSVSAAYE